MIIVFIERMNKLLEGYDNRIKQFILKMAEKPIILKKNKDKNMTTREELYDSSSNKILDKKGFLFKSYKSDKERINEILNNKEILEKCFNKSTKKKYEFIQKLKEIKFIQPSMHFKKRSGLEKIYDLFKKKHHLNNEQKILYEQLIKMGLIHSNFVKYENDNNYENNLKLGIFNYNSSNNIFENNYDLLNNNSLSDEEKYKKFLHNKILSERKNMLIERKLLLNIGNRIKNLDKEKEKQLNIDELEKTHFKAIENLTIFKSTFINHKLFKTWSMEDLIKQQNINDSKKIFYKTISSNSKLIEKKKKKIWKFKTKTKKRILNNININDIKNIKNKFEIKNNNNINTYNNKQFNLINEFKRKKDFNLYNEQQILKDLEIKKEIININPLLFKLNYNNFKNNNNNNNKDFSLDKLNNLKEIAFENSNEESNIRNSKDGFDSYYNDFKKDENIIIDGKYYKKNDIDKIGEKVLKKCNYNNKNVNYKNMGGSGRGKLMFTNGLTLKEFEIKYGILP